MVWHKLCFSYQITINSNFLDYSTSKDQVIELSKFNKDIVNVSDFDTKHKTKIGNNKKESNSPIIEYFRRFR